MNKKPQIVLDAKNRIELKARGFEEVNDGKAMRRYIGKYHIMIWENGQVYIQGYNGKGDNLFGQGLRFDITHYMCPSIIYIAATEIRKYAEKQFEFVNSIRAASDAIMDVAWGKK